MMLGHLMEWFYSGVGGILQLPGSKSYENILIEPEVVGDISWAETEYNSVHGEISTSWKLENNLFILKVKIPVSCKAIVAIPQADPGKITENNIAAGESKDLKLIGSKKGKTLFEISSGEYRFKAKYQR